MVKSEFAVIPLCLVALTGVLAGATGHTLLYPANPTIKPVSLARDPQGLIWIASKDGVLRFDGLHYQNIPGYPFHGARFIAVEPTGAVWAGGAEGLARYDFSEWKVRLSEPIEAMALSPAGLWISARGLRLIPPNGPERRFDSANPTGELVVDKTGSLWFPCGDSRCSMSPPDWNVVAQKIPASGIWKKIVPESGAKRYWLSSPDEMALVDSGVLQWRQQAEYTRDFSDYSPPLDPDATPAGTVWTNRLFPRPIAGLRSWRVPQNVTECVLFTNESTRWSCSGDKVLKSVQDPNWETWSGVPFTARAPEGFLKRPGKAPLLFTERGVVEFNQETREWQSSVTAAKVAVMNMVEDGHGGYWLATRDEGLVRTMGGSTTLERFPTLCPSLDAMRALLRDGRGRTWVGGKDTDCLFEVRGGPGTWKFLPQKLPGGTKQTIEMQTDRKGRPWVAYDYGIAYLNDAGVWERIRTSEPVTMVRSFEFDGEDTIWVARRRPGVFLRLQRMAGGKDNMWQVRQFPGEPTMQTEYIRRDSRGWIWRGTLRDIQVARAQHYEPNDWLTLTTANGLATTGVSLRGWAEDETGSVWVAGTGGVTRMHPSAAWFDAPKHTQPLITRLSVNGQSWLDPAHMPHDFAPAGGPIEIDLSAIDANPFQKRPLQYRLTPTHPEWTASSDGHVQFNGLANGSYTLEASYTGAGAVDVLRWQFQVGNPFLRSLTQILSLGAVAFLAILGWLRREWLQYWVRKRAFMFGRRIRRNEEAVPWHNYSGRTLKHRYDVFETISRGVFSVTYLARDRETAETVVIKVLHPAPGQERWMRHRFAHEVAAMHTLNHPGVVELLDSWIEPQGEPCLVMPYLDGPTLRKLLTDEGLLNPNWAARILDQLGAAVGAIHDHGIVHRDLKPENVIIMSPGTPEEHAIVIDLGTSAARGAEKDLAQTVTVTGSLHYLAPERLGGQYSPASDVYSLGVIALEMLTGNRPAEMAVGSADVEFIGVVASFTGEAAASEIAAALQHQPARRPPDANAWASGLAGLLREFSANHPGCEPST